MYPPSFVKDLKQYIYGVHKKISIVDEYEQIDPLERAVEYVMLGMRTSRDIEHDYRLRCQCDWKPILKGASSLQGKGLGRADGGSLALHRAGLPHFKHAYRHHA